ncbi:hypothetical protein [Thermogemmatispora onikobensis]|uniref:hypothetical protein n=1 Tax=Thermogemmatispora onikobensis TaxID=732234 RepID=UPI00159EF5F5|nr:hypothetical protein [Thermogemmatispora onikobensis]
MEHVRGYRRQVLRVQVGVLRPLVRLARSPAPLGRVRPTLALARAKARIPSIRRPAVLDLALVARG